MTRDEEESFTRGREAAGRAEDLGEKIVCPYAVAGRVRAFWRGVETERALRARRKGAAEAVAEPALAVQVDPLVSKKDVGDAIADLRRRLASRRIP